MIDQSFGCQIKIVNIYRSHIAAERYTLQPYAIMHCAMCKVYNTHVLDRIKGEMELYINSPEAQKL